MSITKEEVAEAVQKWCTAWSTGDKQTIIAMEAEEVGFGFRALSWGDRDYAALGEAHRLQRLEGFFGRMDYYRMVMHDLQTSVRGDIGLAWGVFIEEFQENEQPPERARVRFTKVLTKEATDWKVLLFHRDIQPFNEAGRYPKELTVISSSG